MKIFSGGEFPALKGVRAAIIGIGDEDANAVRRALYPLAASFGKLKIADLGNIRKDSLSFIIPALVELMEARILPILIGNDVYFSLSLYKAAQQVLKNINLVVVDESIRLEPGEVQKSPPLLNPVVLDPEAQLFHLGILGYQAHFTPPEILREMENRNFDCVRLGFARNNFPEIEPIIRDADLCFFNLAAIKQSDAPGQPDPTPGGFSMEEACQICRYAGMSDKLKSFGVFGYRAALDQRQQTAQVTAQMIWYLLEGLYQRKGDFPASLDGLTEYIVELKQLDYPLTFWKSQKTGRWWIQVPVKTSRQHQRHRLIPCSYNDYKLACQEELPERIFNAFKRFD